MKSSLLSNFSVDQANQAIRVEREFAASLAQVWAAWTQSHLLDQWWAPKPWRAKTKTMDFREGGYWLYAMVGPEGEQHWARADFESITPLQAYSAQDAFCDEQGTVDETLPRSRWRNTFREASRATLVTIQIQYESWADLEKTLEMGFQEGFLAALDNLDQLLNAESNPAMDRVEGQS